MRPMLKLTLLGVVLDAALAANAQTPKPAAANSPPAGSPTVDEVLAKWVKAAGGQAALEKVTSRVIKGALEGAAAVPAGATWELSAKGPNKRLVAIQIPNMDPIRDGCNGTVAWSKNPFAGLSVKEGDELAKIKRDATLNRELKFKTLYPDLAVEGKEKVGDEEATVLKAKPTASSSEKFAFSVQSGLLIREESEFETGGNRVTTKVLVSDYQTVDGVKVPGTLRLSITAAGQPPMEFTLKTAEIKQNVPLDDARFEKPAE